MGQNSIAVSFFMKDEISSHFNYNYSFSFNGIKLFKYLERLKHTMTEADFLTFNPRSNMRRDFFPLHERNFTDAEEKLFSFLFVRDPFQRVVSCYYSKITYGPKRKRRLKWMREEILKR